MKKYLVFLFTLLLSSCSTFNNIDCKSLQITGMNSNYEYQYKYRTVQVFEYVNNYGNKIYLDNDTLDNKREKHLDIIVSADYTVQSLVNKYNFNKFVGYVTIEDHYYLNKHKCTVTHKTALSTSSFIGQMSSKKDNRLAAKIPFDNFFKSPAAYSESVYVITPVTARLKVNQVVLEYKNNYQVLYTKL